jgi:hypothetical protein
VTTPDGSFTGAIVWDRDESMAEDILDGETGGEEHEIPFGKIRAIERLDSSSSRVTLTDGTHLDLSGTNDVNDDNRGIVIRVAGLGLVDLEWSDASKVEFTEAPASPTYDSFDGGRELRGIVQTSTGARLSGKLIWDLDETHTWETVDGYADGVVYYIPFSNIATIRPRGSDSAELTLTNGKVLSLSGTGDVSSENRGVILRTAKGEEHRLSWDELRSVQFK